MTNLQTTIEQVLLDNIIIVEEDSQTYQGSPNDLIFALIKACSDYFLEVVGEDQLSARATANGVPYATEQDDGANQLRRELRNRIN